MPQLPRRGLSLLLVVIVVGGPIAWYASRASASEGSEAIVARVKHGDFHVVVTTTGELRARTFVQIQGPSNAQQAELWNGMKIASMVPEGTLVKAGEVVAELDRGPVATKVSEVALALQKAEAQYTQAQLDSTLNLSKAREELRTLEYGLEERRIGKEQAKFEAPSIQRQAEIDYEKAERALAQAKVDYGTKTQQAVAKMSEVGADVSRQRNRLEIVQQVMEGHTVRAPAPGMVIYAREWNGKKKGVGSQVSPWEPTVATLPDLTDMESVTYVNEIDVRRLAVGQPVAIGLDADPGKKLTGKVVSVANVGEQRPNQDAKVFEVKISVADPDTTLRPGMTTSNAVQTAVIEDVFYLPIEAVMYEGAMPYVFHRGGGRVVRREIETGTMNDNEIVVLRGLADGDAVLLTPPTDRASLPLERLDGSSTPPPVAPESAKREEARPQPTVGGDTATTVPVRRPAPPARTP
ncbi:MAG: efflux RND transporter periplasmic adaptor subunit [Gemmatimonadaceae bacterium]